MADFQDKRRWQTLVEHLPSVIGTLTDLAENPPRSSQWRPRLRDVTNEVELALEPWGDIVSVYWPDTWDCQHLEHALTLIRNQEDPGGLTNAVTTVIHKLKLLSAKLAAHLTDEVSGPPADEIPVSQLPDDAMLSPTKLAEVFEVELESLRKRLARLRKKDHSCFVENESRRSREAAYLYRVGAVRPIVAKMKASGKTSGKRPAHK